MPSVAQVVPTIPVFDYLYDPTSGKALANQEVIIQLEFNKATAIAPVVSLPNLPLKVTTDPNGYWTANLVPNTNINPANTVYSVRGGGQSFQISVQAGPGPYQASAIATGQIPALVGGFTAAGTGTIQGALVVTGSFSANNGNVAAVSGALFALNQLQLGSPAAQILARSGQGLDFPSPGIIAFDRTGTGFTTATRQWGEAVLFGAGSDLGQWAISFWDSALAPKHSWVMGLGVDAVDALQWATTSPQSVKMRLKYDGTLELGGHVTTVGATPTIDLVNASLTINSITGTDTAGTIAFTCSGATLLAQTVLMRVNFAVAYPAVPVVICSAMTDTGTGASQGTTCAPTPTILAGSFQVLSPNQITTLHTYAFSYQVIGK